MCNVAHLDGNPPFGGTRNNPGPYLLQRAEFRLFQIAIVRINVHEENEFDFLVRFAYILNRWRFPEGNHYTYIV